MLDIGEVCGDGAQMFIRFLGIELDVLVDVGDTARRDAQDAVALVVLDRPFAVRRAQHVSAVHTRRIVHRRPIVMRPPFHPLPPSPLAPPRACSMTAHRAPFNGWSCKARINASARCQRTSSMSVRNCSTRSRAEERGLRVWIRPRARTSRSSARFESRGASPGS